METKQRIKLFIRFLKENNCQQEFMKEIDKTNKLFGVTYTLENIIKFCSENNLNVFKCIIIPTKNNINFWNNIANKWKNYYG